MILRVRDDEGNVFDIPAIRGLSSYEIAVKHGFEGTEEEWLESIGVEKGDSAYEVWLDAGNKGDVEAFFAYLKGEQGIPGPMPTIGVKQVMTLDPLNVDGTTTNAKVEIDNSDPANPKLVFYIPRGKTGSPGIPGTSVTIESITESTEYGGDNVVTFSNGKTLTIKNGSAGLPSVTTDDNGKFACVEDGVWKAVTIPSAEEAEF